MGLRNCRKPQDSWTTISNAIAMHNQKANYFKNPYSKIETSNSILGQGDMLFCSSIDWTPSLEMLGKGIEQNTPQLLLLLLRSFLLTWDSLWNGKPWCCRSRLRQGFLRGVPRFWQVQMMFNSYRNEHGYFFQHLSPRKVLEPNQMKTLGLMKCEKADKMTQLVRTVATKPASLTLIPRSPTVGDK